MKIINLRSLLSMVLAALLIINLSLPAIAKSAGSENADVEKAARQIFENLSPENQTIFLNEIQEEYAQGNTELLEFHEKVVGQIANKSELKKTNKVSLKAASKDPLDVLERDLKKLDLPTPAYYAFLGVGVSLSAAAVDGPIPIGDIVGIIIAAGCAAVIAYYWDDIEDKWSGVERAFKNAFSTMKSNISAAFDILKLAVLAYVYDEPYEISLSKYPWNELPDSGKHPFVAPRDKAGKKQLKKGNKGGLLDKDGNEWTWDRSGAKAGNPHWDVQHKNGKHTNVNPESSEEPGEVNHGKDNF